MRKFGSFLQSRNGIILVFISFVAFIYFFYGIDQIFGFTGPRYLHEWRQSDCLSLTEHYYQGTGFLEPKMHNYLALYKTSNETAGEFPGRPVPC